MLKFFRSIKFRPENKSTSKLDDLHWPFLSVLFLRLNPFRGHQFFNAMVMMTAKMAIVDGAVSQLELTLFLDLLESHFSLSRRQIRKARKLLFQVSASPKTFTDYINDFYRIFRRHHALIENAFDVLLSMAYVDNVLTRSEQQLLAEAATAFKLSPETVKRLTQRHQNWKTKVEYEFRRAKPEPRSYQEPPKQKPDQGSTQGTNNRTRRPDENSSKQQHNHQQSQQNHHHQGNQQQGQQQQRQKKSAPPRSPSTKSFSWHLVLEIDRNSAPDIVKKRYRKLVSTYHPDRLPKTLPADMIKASTDRFIEIQAAWEAFCRERNISG